MDVSEFCAAARSFLQSADQTMNTAESPVGDIEKALIVNYISYLVENEDELRDIFSDFPFPLSNRDARIVFSAPFNAELVLRILHRVSRIKFLLTGAFDPNHDAPIMNYFSVFNCTLSKSLRDEVERWHDFIVYSLAKREISRGLERFGKEKELFDGLSKKYEGINASMEDSVQRAKAHLDEVKSYAASSGKILSFVGLATAFETLFREKMDELWWSRLVVVCLGLVSLAVPSVALLLYVYSGPVTGWENIIASKILLSLPVVALTAITLYFHRVALSNLRSLRTQIIQLRLRHALCGFVQDYVDFSEKNKSARVTLEKFESIIFSGIVTKPDDIPSTFDGFEKIAELAKSVRS